MGINQNAVYKPEVWLLLLHSEKCFMMCKISAQFHYKSIHVHVEGNYVKERKPLFSMFKVNNSKVIQS